MSRKAEPDKITPLRSDFLPILSRLQDLKTSSPLSFTIDISDSNPVKVSATIPIAPYRYLFPKPPNLTPGKGGKRDSLTRGWKGK